MKKKLLLSCETLIRKYCHYDDIKIEEIMYGLEGAYLTITKLVILVILACIFKIFKEFLILLFFYNLLRKNCFGLHATKSIYCLLTSIIMFIGMPTLAKYIIFPYYLKIIIGILTTILIYKYAPADTHKRPLINFKKRRKYKLISTITSLCYLILIVLDIPFITNYLMMALIQIVIMIHPITYKLFKLPYDNYKVYLANAN